MNFILRSILALFLSAGMAFGQSAPSPIFKNVTAASINTRSIPTSSIVGVSDSQTLTNKTILSPSISSPTISGPLLLDGFGGINQFERGPADGADYTHYNFALRVHYGMGVLGYDGTVQGIVDGRNGVIDMLGGFKQNGVPIAQSVSQRVTVNQFGILLSSNPSNRTANTTALNSLIASQTGPLVINFDRGYFPLDRLNIISNANVTIFGTCGRNTEVNFAANDAPSINISLNDLSYVPDIHCIYFSKANGASPYAAINITRPSVSSGAGFMGPQIYNNIFFGSAGTGDWAANISLTEGWLFRIENNVITGASTSNNSILLNGHSTDGMIRGNQINTVGRAIWAVASSFAEGCVISENKFVNVTWGAYFDDGANAPGGHFINNHVASTLGGIYIYARPQWHITNNLLYMSSGSAANWRGIFVTNSSNDSQINNNTIIGFNPATVAQGILLNGSTGLEVNGNRISNIYTGIDGVNTAGGIVVGNMISGHTQSVVGAAAFNVVANNYP